MTNHYKTEGDIRVYDLKKPLVCLEAIGKKHYSIRFKLYPADKDILHKLLVHVVQDIENCEKHNLDVKKGGG